MNERARGMTASADPAALATASADPASADPASTGPASTGPAHGQAEAAAAVLTAPAAAAEGGGHDGRHRSDTRARIQQVALELFAEQGYDKTSLREIAERLDVTKAALYYHFKSKEDIVRSLVEDYFGQLDAVIAWAKTQPRTARTRREILSRYVQAVAEGSDVFRMLQHNQAALSSLSDEKHRGDVFRERLNRMVDVLTEPGAGMEERLRAAMALGGVSVGWMFFANQVDDRQKLCAAVLDIAADLAIEDAPGLPP